LKYTYKIDTFLSLRIIISINWNSKEVRTLTSEAVLAPKRESVFLKAVGRRGVD